ncbi:spore coat protein YlbD [Tuberibacillus calidus]|uniref:spore coat protein YlbD n=1 Tax=Tuberibacillus calidus TaxID=340097 RepID=UPI0003FB32F2|nr:spore coat protein YlbD [Tuberibacillus calidus]
MKVIVMGRKTNEAVNNFKAFLRSHPEIIQAVKEQGKSWKDVFDEYVLFGEDHEIWESYGVKKHIMKKPPGAAEIMRILDFIGNLDAKAVQEHLEQINGALTNIQELIQLWQPQQQSQQFPMPMPGFGPPNVNGLPPSSGQWRRD